MQKALEALDQSCDGINMNIPARIASRRTVYQGAIFSVEDLDIDLTRRDGTSCRIRRQLVKHPQSVVMLVHDRAKDTYLVEREYRVGSNGFVYGLPAGLIDPGEDVDAAAWRELAEETGVIPDNPTANDIDPVGDYYSSEGMSDELTHVMVIHLRAWSQGDRHFDADEHVESVWVDWPRLHTLPIMASNSVIAIEHEEIRRLTTRS